MRDKHLRPEDASSYDEFLSRLARERNSSATYEGSPLAGLPWAVVSVTTPLAFAFILVALKGSASLWVWPCAVACSALAIGTAGFLVRHMVRTSRRHRQLSQLAREWQERALRGEIPMTESGGPIAEWLAGARLRRDVKVEQSFGPLPPERRPSSMDLLIAGAVAFGMGPVMLFASIATAFFGGPLRVTVVLIVLIVVFGVLGFVLIVAGASRGRRELDQVTARFRRNERG